MSKKITVTLSDKAEQYLAELMYSLTGKEDKPATQSDCINESLETLAMFEKLTDNQLANFNQELIEKKSTPAPEYNFYCADWNRCGSICEEQCPACSKAENMPNIPAPVEGDGDKK